LDELIAFCCTLKLKIGNDQTNICRQTEKVTYRKTDRKSNVHKDRQTYRLQVGKYSLTHKQKQCVERQMDSITDRQTRTER
jgi:hypothetical protein